MNFSLVQPEGFVEQNLLDFILRGTPPETAVDQVAIQLSTGDADEDLTLRERVFNCLENLIAKADYIANYMTFGGNTFKIVG